MPRYIDVDALLEAVKGRRLIFEENTPVEEAIAEQVSVFEEAIEELPAADVVPKSEVERLKKERDEYKKHVDSDIIYVHRIKADVAREIFEEIENLSVDTVDDWGNDVRIISDIDFAELKKKYWMVIVHNHRRKK